VAEAVLRAGMLLVGGAKEPAHRLGKILAPIGLLPAPEDVVRRALGRARLGEGGDHLRRRFGRAGAAQDDVAHRRGAFPRRLLARGPPHHVEAHFLEELLDLQPRTLQRAQQGAVA
jgi:hypothetical protein